MTEAQLNLLMQRLVYDPRKHKGVEPDRVKTKNDRIFCNMFFGCEEIDYAYVRELLYDSIRANNELELDLLLMLLSHFKCENKYSEVLAPLLVQPWHHLHDRIAGVLEFSLDERVTDFLYQGATYRCDNLEYESDYCEFNRKCLFALAKIGTKEAIDYVKKVSDCDNTIIANHALNVMREYGFL